jgi:acetyl esterase/lipase
MRMHLICLTLLVGLSANASAQKTPWHPAPGHITLDLWPQGAPGAKASTGPEIDATTAKDNVIAGKPLIRLGNVSSPTLTLYVPSGKNAGAAVVVFPGGGYHILAIDLEGTEVCDWLTSRGITQRALGMVRAHAAEWHIDPHRVGVLGFSAGAHLSAALSTHFAQRLYDRVDDADQLSCRPDFAVIIYPGYLAMAEENFAPNAEIKVTSETPPSFIVQAEDDPVHVENSTVYFLALKNAKVPAELHIYAEGGHGYGLRRTELPVTAWPHLVETWLQTIHMVSAP